MDKVIHSRYEPPQQSVFWTRHDTYWIKIDSLGNVNIKTKSTTSYSGGSDHTTPIGDLLVINDNIPIPDYLIETLKTLIDGFTDAHYNHYRHWRSIIATIKKLKEGLKETYEKECREIVG